MRSLGGPAATMFLTFGFNPAMTRRLVLVAFLSFPSGGLAQIRLDSLVEVQHHGTGISATLRSDSMRSSLGVDAPTLELSCFDHDLTVELRSAFPPGAVFNNFGGRGDQDISVQADSNKTVKINMEIVPSTTFAKRWLQTTENAERWLKQMVIARTLTVRWKLDNNYEQVMAVFHLDTLPAVRKARLARPWQACGRNVPW